ncbi:MAG: hypothetical protein HC892_07530 [Saprospiraceae bacterium]|nr:hypothetical protein [Saprospiraceae bacterium]
MRLIINLILLLITIGLLYVLIVSIREPIAFASEKTRREAAVKDRLIQIRKAQELYRGITDTYAPNFDTLEQVLRTGAFKIVKVTGDPDDPTGMAISYDTIVKPAIDSVQSLGLLLDSLRYIPYTNKVEFDIAADTITYQQTLVSVVEVGAKRSVFMGRFADTKYIKYDNKYDPNAAIKFGDMNTPKLSGNWESN